MYVWWWKVESDSVRCEGIGYRVEHSPPRGSLLQEQNYALPMALASAPASHGGRAGSRNGADGRVNSSSAVGVYACFIFASDVARCWVATQQPWHSQAAVYSLQIGSNQRVHML